MTNAPEPLTPSDCDLRDFAFMPLDVRRLLTSETWVLGTPAEKIAALTLWCEAWHQMPAGSLPDNDRMLAHLSGAGATWQKVKPHAMRGWVKCSDGRLYHPVVADKARDAWAKKEIQRERSRKANAVRWGHPRGNAEAGSKGGGNQPQAVHEDMPDQSQTIPQGIPQGHQQGLPQASLNDPKGQGEREGEKKERVEAPLAETDPLTAPRAASPKRGQRIPENWEPSEADRDFARALRLPIARTADNFRDYWTAKAGKDGTKLDWSATWRTWCRREADRPQPRPAPEFRNGFLAAIAADHLRDDDDQPSFLRLTQ